MFNFSRPEQKVIIFLIFSALVGSGVLLLKGDLLRDNPKLELASSGGRINPTSPATEIMREKTLKKIDINKATFSELRTLPRIRSRLAWEIIRYRENKGLFQSIEDIKKVPGIKEGIFNAIKDRIFVATQALSVTAEVKSALPKDKTPTQPPLKVIVLKKTNINTADERELENLPGIGPSLARRIIEYRNSYGPFKDINDIKKVKGIGEKKFQELKDLITVD